MFDGCVDIFDKFVTMTNKSLMYTAAQNVRAPFASSIKQIFLYISLRNKNYE